MTGATEALADVKPFTGDTEKGKKIGTVVHRMLEALARDQENNVHALAKMVMEEEGLADTEREGILSMVSAVLSSDLWARMTSAERLMVEVPFSLEVEGEAVPRVVSGIIDVAFREPDGWVIVDYKTNSNDENIDALVSYYRPQIEMYRRYWEEISGDRVKEAGLYFVSTDRWVSV